MGSVGVVPATRSFPWSGGRPRLYLSLAGDPLVTEGRLEEVNKVGVPPTPCITRSEGATRGVKDRGATGMDRVKGRGGWVDEPSFTLRDNWIGDKGPECRRTSLPASISA